MRRLLTLITFLSLGVAGLCATTFTWTVNGPGFSAGGILNATPLSGDEYVVVSGSGVIDTVTIPGSGMAAGDVLVLYPGGGDGSTQSSPSGAFNFDNLIFRTADPMLDSTGGLLFIDTAPGAHAAELNIWGDALWSSYPCDGYCTWVAIGTSYVLKDNGSTFTLTEVVPEPATILLAAAVLLLGRFARGRRAPVMFKG